METTFFMIKPDGVQRNLMGDIIARLERKGLQCTAMKLLEITPELARQHYAEHVDKPFFPDLLAFITSGPVLATAWQGEDAVALVRRLMGGTDPSTAAPGTLRGDYGISLTKNVVHGSDSPASAERELALFFKEEELLAYTSCRQPWLS